MISKVKVRKLNNDLVSQTFVNYQYWEQSINVLDFGWQSFWAVLSDGRITELFGIMPVEDWVAGYTQKSKPISDLIQDYSEVKYFVLFARERQETTGRDDLQITVYLAPQSYTLEYETKKSSSFINKREKTVENSEKLLVTKVC